MSLIHLKNSVLVEPKEEPKEETVEPEKEEDEPEKDEELTPNEIRRRRLAALQTSTSVDDLDLD